MDPAVFVRPRALLDAVSRSPGPMRRANQPEEVKCCAETGVDVGEVDHQHGHPESHCAVDALCGGSREVDATFGRSAPRYVEFGANSALSAQSVRSGVSI